MPGDFNGVSGGGFGGAGGATGLAAAPLPNMPAGVVLRPTVAGLAFVTRAAGFPLYYSDRDTAGKSTCDAVCTRTWQPLAAPALGIEAAGDWSLATRPDGSRQWAYKGRPLYTNVADVEGESESVAGAGEKGWHAAALMPVPELPSQIVAKMLPIGHIYTDTKGHPLYTYSCNEAAPDGLTCDEPGDSEVYWTAICGLPERCAQLYRPFTAAPQAKPPAGTPWTIVTIDSRSPVRPPTDPKFAVQAWAYRGKPLYTSPLDRELGDANGQFGAQQGGGMGLIRVYGN
jgi:predicted lipoprotein with Yx(FWY)xxD motif